MKKKKSVTRRGIDHVQVGVFFQASRRGVADACRGLTLIELMVALVILSVGIVGIGSMVSRVLRGNRTTALMDAARRVAQVKLDELRDLARAPGGFHRVGQAVLLEDAYEYGWPLGGMVQERGLNPLGFSALAQLDLEVQRTPACATVPSGTALENLPDACRQVVEAAGPYVFTRTFIICQGTDYGADGQHLKQDVRPQSVEARVAQAEQTATRGAIELDCVVHVGPDGSDVGQTRPRALTCSQEDLTHPPGPQNLEKIAKVLVTWRSSQAECHSVALSATLPVSTH